jgi:thioredoxin 2
MSEKTVYLRCDKCGVLNRVPADKIHSDPKCGKCKDIIQILHIPVDVTTANFDKEVLAWPGTVAVEFWTPWCGHCRTMAPLLEKLAREKAGLLKVVRVNLDSEPLLGPRFGVTATPTFYVYQNGHRHGDISGAVPKDQFEAWIEAVLLAS